MSLNDPHWGRGSSEENKEENKNGAPNNDSKQNDNRPRDEERFGDQNRQNDNRKTEGDDLDRLWDEFNQALGGMLGRRNDDRGQSNQGSGAAMEVITMLRSN